LNFLNKNKIRFILDLRGKAELENHIRYNKFYASYSGVVQIVKLFKFF